jgi:hypothetical protein
MSKNPKPTIEELRYIYDLILQGYDDDILAEYASLYHASTLMFPYRTDKRFARERRKELSATQGLVKERMQATDPLIVEDKRKHLDKMRELMKKWKEQLTTEVAEPLGGYVPNFPTQFTKEDNNGPAIYEPRGSLCWEVNRDNSVNVWFLVEHDPLFPYLREHLSESEIWSIFDDIKQELTKAISEIASSGKKTQVENMLQLTNDIAEILETEIERVTIPGNCLLCR